MKNKTKFIAWTLAVTALSTLFSCGPKVVDPTLIKKEYIHTYGAKISEKGWEKSGRTGKEVLYLKNGSTVVQPYKNGILEGDVTVTFPYSQVLERIDTYKQGKLISRRINHTTGVPLSEESFSGNRREVTRWYEKGSPQSKELYEKERLLAGEYYLPSLDLESQIQDGEGTRVQRDFTGLLLSKDTYEKGVLVTLVSYYPLGTPSSVSPYQNGKIVGKRQTFYEDGSPKTVEEWVEGNQQGITVEFQNGEKVAETPYVNGQKHGKQKCFKDGQAIVKEVTWVRGVEHGPTFHYVNGQTHTDWYYRGKLVTKAYFDLRTRP
ncbi:MAG: hypothetical protein K0S74_1254 [Chlamydiales bacterium]|jgi:antitoxin component YwqK of YwqJK toxin-antitoxin module|nr:hypothetical protein [Chlamydiales bacterium]